MIQRPLLKKIVLSVAIIGSLIFFVIHRSLFLFPHGVDRIVSCIVYPVIKLQDIVFTPIRAIGSKKYTIAALQAEVVRLQKENEQLQAECIQADAEQNFVQKISEIVAFSKRYDTENAQLAQIILRECSSENHMLLCDVGSVHGIEKDMVAVYKNCLVGRVDTVFPFYCKVIPITDKRCKVAAYVHDTNAHGIYSGQNSTMFGLLEHVSHLQRLQKGSRIFSSGQGLVFPRGFALGRIDDYHVDGVEYNVSIKPLIDVFAIDYCYIIKKGQENNL